MSEKIYAWLLRLVLPHFHRAFGDVALELFRDRSRDERGFLRTLRLWWDLLADLAVSVHRDHRFAESTLIGTTTARNFDAMPSFHAVESAPPRVLALVLGGVLSMLALGAFPTLINHPPIAPIRESSSTGLDGGTPTPSGPILSFLLLLDGSPHAQQELRANHGIPDTPAGKVLDAWIKAFNSADPAKIKEFENKFDPTRTVIFEEDFRARTGGFDLLSVISKEPLLLSFRVKEKNGSTEAIGSMRLSEAQPPSVLSFTLRALPPGAVYEEVKLDAAERKRVIDGVISNLKEYYVYPKIAQKMVDALVAREKGGGEAETDGAAFADSLTKQLQEVSHDRHLRVVYSPFKTPEHPPARLEDDAEFRKQLEHDNCAFTKVEVLPGNIGYLKFNAFPPPALCQSTAVAAMGFLAHVDAIIFDLRDNHGGDPHMVAFIASYLFDRATHLNDIYNRRDNSTQQFWTSTDVPGTKLVNQPAYVLTSNGTFSGAEEFTYDLKNLKRATIVGEKTGGGAHLVGSHRIDDHFAIGVPFARAVNPISKTDWEGTGVAPDVTVKAADALETAEKLAQSKLQKK